MSDNILSDVVKCGGVVDIYSPQVVSISISADGLRKFIEQLLSAALAAHEETKRQLKELQEQKPVAYGSKCTRTNKWGYIWHTLEDVQGWINLQHQSLDDCTYSQPIPLYAYPIDVEPLLQQARKEENEACAEVCEVWNTTPGRRLAELIRARMK